MEGAAEVGADVVGAKVVGDAVMGWAVGEGVHQHMRYWWSVGIAAQASTVSPTGNHHSVVFLEKHPHWFCDSQYP